VYGWIRGLLDLTFLLTIGVLKIVARNMRARVLSIVFSHDFRIHTAYDSNVINSLSEAIRYSITEIFRYVIKSSNVHHVTINLMLHQSQSPL
jgi:hypothetical protein